MASSSKPPILLIFAFVLILNIALWSSSSRFAPGTLSTSSSPILAAFGFNSTRTLSSTPSLRLGALGFPFPGPSDPPPTDGHEWALVPLLLFYTVFLLAFLGICAGDFLVANLATIAEGLGMSDNTAGVTLLALGNGSPDVFSTYASFTANSGSLAIGELLGAATFIISVVVGSMALVKPFHVHPGPFIRDVGFAIAAVSLLLGVMHDGKLEPWETVAMIGLYCLYVVWVIGGTKVMEWRERRRKDAARRDLLGVEEDGVPHFGESDPLFHSDPSTRSYSAVRSKAGSPQQRPVSLGHVNSTLEATSLTHPRETLAPIDTNVSHHRTLSPGLPTSMTRKASSKTYLPRRSRANSSASNLDVRRTTFSLLGAVEFRDVVNSLRAEGEDLTSLENQHLAATPFASGHYHSHLPSHHRRGSMSPHTSTPNIRRNSSRKSHRRSKSVDRSGKPASMLDAQTPSSTFQPSETTLSTPEGESDSRGTSSKINSGPASPSPRRSTQRSGTLDEEYNPWSDVHVVAGSVGSESTIRASGGGRSVSREPEESGVVPSSSFPSFPSTSTLEPSAFITPQARSPVPSIHLIPPPDPSSSSSSPPSPPLRIKHLLLPTPHHAKRRYLLHIARITYHTLLPSLQAFRHKSLVGKVLSILATPAILALTLTLPVVDNHADSEGSDSTERGEEKWVDEWADGERVTAESVLGGDVGDDEEESTSPDRNRRSFPRYHDEPDFRDDPVGWEEEEHHHQSNMTKAGGVLHARLVDIGGDPTHPRSPSTEEVHHDRTRLEAVDRRAEREREYEEDEDEDESALEEDEEEEERMEEEEDDVHHVLGFNKWLLAVQCALGPAFCAGVLFSESDTWIPIIVLSSLGLVLGFITLVYAWNGENRVWRLGRCLLGFSVAMIWIMAIADEVVSVLTVLGEIFGLSDAIIGLTIFAVGNSTADLVANLSIASFAPIMAFSACFGGPMLNILLGVGFSGAFVTISSGKAYPISFSPTLVASTAGLLSLLVITLIFVPLNGYHITRRWGVFLIGFYVVSMTCNILAEVFLE
ncbi:Sodium/calcium exchanger protein-domain-containing protein [Mrakia frigida]|uniref:Sodium/calcium exchanger protein-domain-containing protein n=1 Tax=Mrakia frigida TaxID=29902 RepID=UPI003FCBF635